MVKCPNQRENQGPSKSQMGHGIMGVALLTRSGEAGSALQEVSHSLSFTPPNISMLQKLRLGTEHRNMLYITNSMVGDQGVA